MAARADIPKMKLWYYPQYANTRCAWLIKELGLEDKVEYKYVPVSPEPPSEAREEYRKTVHPHNTVPALEIEGAPTMLESAAICMYLADLCPEKKFAPEPNKRAEYYDWILYTLSRLDEAMRPLARQWLFGPKDVPDEVMTKAKATADLCLDKVERTLKDREYILGSQITAADCVLGFSLSWANHSDMNDRILTRDRPNIQAYLDRIKARPALKEALAMPKQ